MAEPVGRVVSDGESPTFESIAFKIDVSAHVRPGMLVVVECSEPHAVRLIARVRSAREHNPNETAEDATVREALHMEANYPVEADSTTIHRLAHADLLAELYDENS